MAQPTEDIVPLRPLSVGDFIFARDSHNHWYLSEVRQVNQERRAALIHFCYWSARWDEWIPISVQRMRMYSNPPSNLSQKTVDLSNPADAAEHQRIQAALGTFKARFATSADPKPATDSMCSSLLNALISQEDADLYLCNSVYLPMIPDSFASEMSTSSEVQTLASSAPAPIESLDVAPLSHNLCSFNRISPEIISDLCFSTSNAILGSPSSLSAVAMNLSMLSVSQQQNQIVGVHRAVITQRCAQLSKLLDEVSHCTPIYDQIPAVTLMSTTPEAQQQSASANQSPTSVLSTHLHGSLEFSTASRKRRQPDIEPIHSEKRMRSDDPAQQHQQQQFTSRIVHLIDTKALFDCDASPAALRLFLRYLYTDGVDLSLLFIDSSIEQRHEISLRQRQSAIPILCQLMRIGYRVNSSDLVNRCMDHYFRSASVFHSFGILCIACQELHVELPAIINTLKEIVSTDPSTQVLQAIEIMAWCLNGFPMQQQQKQEQKLLQSLSMFACRDPVISLAFAHLSAHRAQLLSSAHSARLLKCIPTAVLQHILTPDASPLALTLQWPISNSDKASTDELLPPPRLPVTHTTTLVSQKSRRFDQDIEALFMHCDQLALTLPHLDRIIQDTSAQWPGFSDIALLNRNRVFLLHSFVLRSRSGFFNAALRRASSFSEIRSRRVQIQLALSDAAIRCILHFIYCGRLLDLPLGEETESSIVTILEILEHHKFFALESAEELSNRCEALLNNFIIGDVNSSSSHKPTKFNPKRLCTLLSMKQLPQSLFASLVNRHIHSLDDLSALLPYVNGDFSVEAILRCVSPKPQQQQQPQPSPPPPPAAEFQIDPNSVVINMSDSDDD